MADGAEQQQGLHQKPGYLTIMRRGCCPACGLGCIFSGYLEIVPVCPQCGLQIGAHDSGDGPAVLLIFILGALVVPLAIRISFLVSWPLWLHALIWGPLILGLTVGMLRPARALTLAVQYRRRAAGPDWQPPS